jgi:two-component system nitrogen regulation sensor histidine kinase NtrY
MSYNPENLTPEQRERVRRRRRLMLWALGLTVALLLAIIVSQQLWLWTVIMPDTASDTLLLYALSTLNFVAFVVFSFIFVRNLLKLRRERNERQLGSKVKTRLLVYFISISFLPIAAMAAFSYLFLNRSLEKWFYPFPEGIVQQSNQLKRETQARQNQTLQNTASLIVMLLNREGHNDRQPTLDQIVRDSQLVALEVVDTAGNVKLLSHAPLKPEETQKLEVVLKDARQNIRANETRLINSQEFDAAVVPLSQTESLIVAPQKRPINDLNELLTGTERGYQELVTKQRRVRLLGLSTLGLMTLILFFVSSWVATYLARGIANPIKALAEASKEIARGNLAHRVTTFADDELALLAQSFNQMTTQLEENRSRIEAGAEELREKNQALNERRNYIETVLQSLSTGVVSIDEGDRITTLNHAAVRMLGLSDKTNGESRLRSCINEEDWPVVDRLLKRARRSGHATEQTQLESGATQGTGPLPVAMTATALRDSLKPAHGVVLVIEDLSELLSAQRAAAWSEVARRMAHEIKNPLTPIQLSAERIAKTYGRNGSSDEDKRAAVIAECTQTITREVAGLKSMVDEFSRFARLPATRLVPANLNEAVSQALKLYDERLDDVEVVLNLAEDLPDTLLDAEQIKRVFVNLIDNALAALANVEMKQVTIKTSQDIDRSLLIAEVIDSGKGIVAADFSKLFQPYFSRSDNGTGLGLAIVQRIILEHGGRIRASNNYPHGARFVIELPTG